MGSSEVGRTPTFVRCFKYGEFRHRISECKRETTNFFKYGKPGHQADDFRSNNLTWFNCGEQGYISTQCEKPNKAQPRGKFLHYLEQRLLHLIALFMYVLY